jgi:predicted CoA-binding protein
LDIANDEAAKIATEGGLDVVMDRCTAIEVGRLL